MIARRTLIGTAGAFLGLSATGIKAMDAFRLGLTPVFLDNDAEVVDRLRAAFADALGIPVELEQRRTYEEVTGLLLEGSVDAAWLCGFPYLQHRKSLELMAVPVWNGRPLYQSYLIAGQGNTATNLSDLRGGTHAFSDPDSNSGYLVTASDLARMHERPDSFFKRTIFTFGHRNVVRAVGDGLVQSGSVDGYVWEALSKTEPDLAERTRVISKSEWLGFPPFCTRADRAGEPTIRAARLALLGMSKTTQGKAALDLLQLDSMAAEQPSLYDGIAKRMRELEKFL
ncbi:ABC transporter, substrate-binding protein (cluster 12, methionine/phosphonates) [hydrothermal vent metagenome]|uniref:ABC transporter, substrate-binding protein (Cluster 12, methionine/phosphonates) n=1 Tax=hydrothermal vent metagenome TaxID=652676 RepID=A0A3B0RVI1_9ZZZZ